MPPEDRSDSVTVTWTPYNENPRRYVFEPTSRGDYTRVEEAYRGGEWCHVGRDTVRDVTLDSGEERGRGVDHLDDRTPLAFVYDGEALVMTLYEPDVVEEMREDPGRFTVSLTIPGEHVLDDA